MGREGDVERNQKYGYWYVASFLIIYPGQMEKLRHRVLFFP